MADRILSQYEIDDVFRTVRDQDLEDSASKKAQLYDWRRPDRIAKDQIQSIHLVHENFARSLSSGLSAYLRSYVLVSFISVEQISFADFVRSLPSPSCLMSLGAQPYEDSGVFQIDRALVFVILEVLLGGSASQGLKVERDLTEIERGVLDTVYRILLQDLHIAWQTVANIEFVIQNYLSEPQLLQALPPDEPVVVVSMEMRVGESSGLMHIALPSTFVKGLREKSGRKIAGRRREVSDADYARILNLLQTASVEVEARLEGAMLPLNSIMHLEPGDVINLGQSATKEFNLMLNGKTKFRGHIVAAGHKAGFQVKTQI